MEWDDIDRTRVETYTEGLLHLDLGKIIILMCISGDGHARGYINTRVEHFEEVVQLGMVDCAEGKVLTYDPLDDLLIEGLAPICAACCKR